MANIARTLITPELAKRLLQTQSTENRTERNRPISKTTVAKYANDMKNGRWTDNNDLICIDEDGRLINGQHRMSAVVMSGASVWMDVKYGVQKNTVMDRGLLRSTSQSLFMRGLIPDDLATFRMVAVVRRFLLIYGVEGMNSKNFPDDVIADFMNKNVENLRIAGKISRFGGSLLDRAPGTVAIFAALSCGVSSDILFEFAEIVNGGFMTDSRQSSAIVCRNYCLSHTAHGHTANNLMCSYVQTAIKDFANGVVRKRGYTNATNYYIDALRKRGFYNAE